MMLMINLKEGEGGKKRVGFFSRVSFHYKGVNSLRLLTFNRTLNPVSKCKLTKLLLNRFVY